MFTGIVTDLGRIASVTDSPDGRVRRFRVESRYDPAGVDLGASIMHNGVCLTVVGKGGAPGAGWWDIEAVPETLSRTNLGQLKEGDPVNLERSMQMGDEFGGHFVFGHVDGLGEIVALDPAGGGSWRVRIRAPEGFAPFLAEKGSVAVDGISLTVAAVDGDAFEIAVIPHTWSATTLHARKVGDRVNLEADMLARFVARQLAARLDAAGDRT